HKALDAGINPIETSDAYDDSEEVICRALKGRCDSVVLATEFGLPAGEDPNQRGASRRWITTAVDNSLRRLQTDHIDIYQLQRPDRHGCRGDTFSPDRPGSHRKSPRPGPRHASIEPRGSALSGR